MSLTKEDRKKMLIKNLEEKYLSMEDMTSLLNCTSRYIYKLLSDIKMEYNVKESLVKRKKFFHIENSDFVFDYDSITNDIITKFLILKEIEFSSATKKDYMQRFNLVSNKNNLYNNKYDDSKITLNIGKSEFYNKINELKSENLIVYNKNDKKYHISSTDVFMNISCSYSELLEIENVIKNISNAHPHYRALNEVLDIICALFGDEIDNLKDKSYYLNYGYSKDGLKNIDDFISNIKSFDFVNKSLNITYQTNDNINREILFSIGAILYSQEKNKLYLIGKEHSDDSVTDSIIKTESILSISESENKNHFYKSDYYIKLFNSMFSISIDAPVFVKVEFNNTPSVTRKITQLNKKRVSSKIEYVDKKIIYTDTISGLPDFFNYLRSFGDDCKVLEPKELKDKMIFSIDRSLKRYNDLREDDLNG